MEMLLKDGLVNDQSTIEFIDSDVKIDKRFNQSFNNVIYLIDGYDIKKSKLSNDKDVYFLYYFKINYHEVESTLNNILLGKVSDILNIEDSNILYSINSDESNNFFWDVLNDIIIVIGKENLKVLMLELEKKRWDCINIDDEEFMQKYIELCASKVYKKVMRKS